jgi:hypothetical protein
VCWFDDKDCWVGSWIEESVVTTTANQCLSTYSALEENLLFELSFTLCFWIPIIRLCIIVSIQSEDPSSS